MSNLAAANIENPRRPIYLDYAATTPVDSRVASKMSEFMTFEGTFVAGGPFEATGSAEITYNVNVNPE